MISRLTKIPIRGYSSSVHIRARSEGLSEKFHFATATVFAFFGIGMSTMGLTQLSHYRNTHKIE